VSALDTFFVLGADGQLGRDEFLRLLYGVRPRSRWRSDDAAGVTVGV
jgi:hypothetical protein